MKALVYRGPYRVRVEARDQPRAYGANHAVVRVTQATTCSADLHLSHPPLFHARAWPRPREFVGVVHEVGASVRRLAAGDRLTVPYNAYCGACPACERCLYSMCSRPFADAPGGLLSGARQMLDPRHRGARTTHWLVLLAADRIDVTDQVAASLFCGHPDSPAEVEDRRIPPWRKPLC